MLHQLKDVFRSLKNHRLRYVVIGGIAAIMRGVPRTTFDLNVLIAPTIDNARRLLAALEEAGLGSSTLVSAEGVLAHEIINFQDRVRVDVQTSTPGLSFEHAWLNRETMTYQGQDFEVVSREHLIASKRAARRKVDLEDISILEDGDNG